jgi:hypothetical protein
MGPYLGNIPLTVVYDETDYMLSAEVFICTFPQLLILDDSPTFLAGVETNHRPLGQLSPATRVPRDQANNPKDESGEENAEIAKHDISSAW